MALREFAAKDGRRWHVWDITPEKMHPSTRAEDYLQGVLEGWLVFEALDGQGKARLYPIPADWATASDEELRTFLAQASAVREPDRRSGALRGTASAASGETTQAPRRADDREIERSGTPSMDVRTFRYPGGRVWTVAERAADAVDGSAPLLLRFSSGSRSLDMPGFPRDWSHYTDDQLIDLLCFAFPRPAADGRNDSHEHRRRSDTVQRPGHQP